jgi:excisionase family DNA binding protein
VTALEPVVYTVSEVAELLGIHRNTVLRLIARDELPVVKLGPRAFRIPRNAIERLLEDAT